jgi:AraC-like DNA-binding protein
MAHIPVISSHVLRGLPAFIRDELGEKALHRANRAARFDAELIEDKNYYVAQRSVLDFVNATVEAAGEPNLGLLLAHSMNVADYGTFGSYVFSADTLDQAIRRSIMALRFHSTFDKLLLTTIRDEVRYSYSFALAGSQGYQPIASTAAGELVSLFKAYLPDTWRPLRVELDIPKPTHTTLFEDVFECPVVFNAPAVAVVAERHHLAASSKSPARSVLTIDDVARDCGEGAPRNLLNVVFELIRTQLTTGNVSIEEAAQSIDVSVRTLQRELGHAGTDFRRLTSSVRVSRATELLRSSTMSITSISEELGYSSPAGLSRAFRKATGVSPREFRSMETGEFEEQASNIEGGLI